MISSVSPSSSISYASSSAASMSSFSSNSSSLPKSTEFLKTNAKNKETNKQLIQSNVLNVTKNNQFISNKHNAKSQATSMSVLARVTKLQQENNDNNNYEKLDSLTSFDKISDLILTDQDFNGNDSRMDTIKIEKISLNLKTKIDNLILTYTSGSPIYKNTSSASQSTTTSSIPNSAFKLANPNLNTSNHELVSPTNSTFSSPLYDENFISSLFSILFNSNYKGEI